MFQMLKTATIGITVGHYLWQCIHFHFICSIQSYTAHMQFFSLNSFNSVFWCVDQVVKENWREALSCCYRLLTLDTHVNMRESWKNKYTFKDRRFNACKQRHPNNLISWFIIINQPIGIQHEMSWECCLGSTLYAGAEQSLIVLCPGLLMRFLSLD